MIQTYYSAAKINLYLRVEGKQKDGYHNLVSVMQSVSLYDRLDFDFSQRDFSLSVGKKDLGDPQKNTVTRTWHLMKEKFSLPDGVAVQLSKNIPLAAGLGGGSGNAAATLHAVNDYFSLGLSPEELGEIGVEIGADIPFCVLGGTALAKGKGEILTPLKDLPKCNMLLANNGSTVSTKAVFSDFDKLPSVTSPSEDGMLEAISSENIFNIGKFLYNDLERVTFQKIPSLEVIKENWRKEGLFSLMSGSGPSVFALAEGSRWKDSFVNWNHNNGKLFHVTPVSFGVIKQVL